MHALAPAQHSLASSAGSMQRPCLCTLGLNPGKAHLDLVQIVAHALAAAQHQVGRKVERDRAAQPAQRLVDAQALLAGRLERAVQVRRQGAAVDRPASPAQV